MTTYAKIQRLIESDGEDIDNTFRRLGELLRDSGRTAFVQCTIIVGDRRRHWTFNLQANECQVNSDTVMSPDLEIITGEGTWREIAEGRVSPIDAFKTGRLRVLGDTKLGSHLLRLVGSGEGTASICGE